MTHGPAPSGNPSPSNGAPPSGPQPPPRRRTLLGPGAVLVLFWASSLSVGFAAFVALAGLSHEADDGGLAAASAVLGVSFLPAVVPGAIQLRAAAVAAGGTGVAGIPVRLVAVLSGGLLLGSPLVGALLTVPALSIALLAIQVPFTCVVAVQRGTAIGREEFGRASASMGIDALLRLVAGIGLGIAFGATGLAAALLLGSLAAVALGRGWYPRLAGAPASSVLGPAITVGALMLLINLHVLAAPRVLGAEAADAYAIAELPAKGVFFALFAVSWLAVPIATRSIRRLELLRPIAAMAAIGVLCTGALMIGRPLLPVAFGGPVPGAGLLLTLAAGMSLAGCLATALAMGIARDAPKPWLPLLVVGAVLGALIVALEPGSEGLALLVLASQAVALAATTLGLLRTAGRSFHEGDVPPGGAPAGSESLGTPVDGTAVGP